MRATTFIPVFFALALTIPASAAGCVPTTSHADITVGDYYVDDILSCSQAEIAPCTNVCAAPGVCVQSMLWWMWIYEETNGIAGLQRMDEIHDDTCLGQIPGDTIHY